MNLTFLSSALACRLSNEKHKFQASKFGAAYQAVIANLLMCRVPVASICPCQHEGVTVSTCHSWPCEGCVLRQLLLLAFLQNRFAE
jgi:hypothetical protein